MLGALLVGPVLSHAQGAGGLAVGGIPYTPWLLPIIFVIAGIGYSVSRWYWKRPRVHFELKRCLKTCASGAGIGLVVFGSVSAAQAHSITETLLAGDSGVVDPHVFGGAVMAAYLLIAGTAASWKAARGAVPPAGGTPA